MVAEMLPCRLSNLIDITDTRVVTMIARLLQGGYAGQLLSTRMQTTAFLRRSAALCKCKVICLSWQTYVLGLVPFRHYGERTVWITVDNIFLPAARGPHRTRLADATLHALLPPSEKEVQTSHIG